jgi:hypothetical protein
VRLPVPTPEPIDARRSDMTVRICDRCGVITVEGEGCICTTPYSLSAIRRRHQAAVESARSIRRGGRVWAGPGEDAATVASPPPSPGRPTPAAANGAVPHRIAAAAIPAERAQARVPGPDSPSRPGGAADACTSAAPSAPHDHRPAPELDVSVPPDRPLSTD